jgi:hypothetical protein
MSEKVQKAEKIHGFKWMDNLEVCQDIVNKYVIGQR